MGSLTLDRSSCPSCLAVFRGGYQRCPHDGAVLVRSDKDPLVGTVLAERYSIESVIGEGGIGRVYRARHVRMSRRYANNSSRSTRTTPSRSSPRTTVPTLASPTA